MMKVEYVDHMGADLNVVNAARVSFDKQSDLFNDKDAGLIGFLAREQHELPFAHTCISLRIKAPIFVARQLGKHQVGLSWNEVSRRYVDSKPEFYLPRWRRRPDKNIKQGSGEEFGASEQNDHTFQWEEALVEAVASYGDLLRDGVCPEQARMVLPQSMMTTWIWTGSLLAFARVCNLRLDSHTQKETRDVAKMISEVVGPLYPTSWKELVRV